VTDERESSTIKLVLQAFTIGLATILIGRSIWKDVLRSQRRQTAVGEAASRLQRSEQFDWFN
jgi:hypothetical protein